LHGVRVGGMGLVEAAAISLITGILIGLVSSYVVARSEYKIKLAKMFPKATAVKLPALPPLTKEEIQKIEDRKAIEDRRLEKRHTLAAAYTSSKSFHSMDDMLKEADAIMASTAREMERIRRAELTTKGRIAEWRMLNEQHKKLTAQWHKQGLTNGPASDAIFKERERISEQADKLNEALRKSGVGLDELLGEQK
jgi:hypothetical protein